MSGISAGLVGTVVGKIELTGDVIVVPGEVLLDLSSSAFISDSPTRVESSTSAPAGGGGTG